MNGLKVRYAKIGEGGPFVFILHGWPGSLESWLNVGQNIAQSNYQVILPDFPGFGQSQEPFEPWEVKDYATWLKNFINQILSRFEFSQSSLVIVGHSFGGRVAIKFGAMYPQMVSKLVLVSSAGIKRKTLPILKYLTPIGKIIFSLPGLKFLAPIFKKVFYKFIIRSTDYLNVKGVMRETFKKVVREDLTPLLSKINAPTLIIWGSKDKKTPLKEGEIMRSKIKNSKLEVLIGVGHSPNKEVPDLVASKIIDFLIKS